MSERRLLAILALLAAATVSCRRPEEPSRPVAPPAPAPTVAPTPAPVASPAAVPVATSSPSSFPSSRPGGDVSQPRLLAHQNPPVPSTCQPLSVGGPESSFVFEVGVGESGAVTGVRTLVSPSFSPPCPQFEPAWHAAIRQWQYAPALRNGAPVAVTVRVSIDFRS